MHPQLSSFRNILLALVALATLALSVPAAAPAATYHDAIRDCNDDGVIQGTYTRNQVRRAIRNLPSSLREYSDCEDVLRAYLASLNRKNRPGGSPGGGAVPPPADPALTTPSGAIASRPEDFEAVRGQTKRSQDGQPPQVDVAGDKITPGTGGLVGAAARTDPNKLPAPLLWALAGLAAMGALAGLLVMRHRWPEMRRVALRLLRR
jgi:hypothetical protein